MTNQPSLQRDLEILDALRVEMQDHWPALPPEGIYRALNLGVYALKQLIKEYDAAGLSEHRVDL